MGVTAQAYFVCASSATTLQHFDIALQLKNNAKNNYGVIMIISMISF